MSSSNARYQRPSGRSAHHGSVGPPPFGAPPKMSPSNDNQPPPGKPTWDQLNYLVAE